MPKINRIIEDEYLLIGILKPRLLVSALLLQADYLISVF